MTSITVIIPVYNRARLLKRALESVLNQSHPASEIIIVDDGSTDNTLSLLEPYLKQIKIIRQKNQGVSAARNRGIKEAGSDWLAFLDSDDEWLPNRLENAVNFLRTNPDCRIFQCEEIWIRNNRRVNPKKKHKKTGGWIFRESLPLCIVSPSALMAQRNLFDKVGRFDETLPVCEDYDLWLRVLRKYPIALDERPGIIKYGGHEDQLSRKYRGMDYYRVLAMEKHVHDPQLEPSLRKAVLLEIVKKLRILDSGAKKRGRQWDEVEQKLKNYLTECGLAS